jgi:hypothetical protein
MDWMIHAPVLGNLRPIQQKARTQMIHEWLPVNDHPGQA